MTLLAHNVYPKLDINSGIKTPTPFVQNLSSNPYRRPTLSSGAPHWVHRRLAVIQAEDVEQPCQRRTQKEARQSVGEAVLGDSDGPDSSRFRTCSSRFRATGESIQFCRYRHVRGWV